MTRCQRCGEPFELRRAGDRHCLRCEREVEQLIRSDERRRTRFGFAKALSPGRTT